MLSTTARKAASARDAALLGDAARLFKALGHPLRLRIVCGLLRQTCTQTEIASCLGLPQSSVAQHLAVLRRAGLVEGRRSGNEVILCVADPRAGALLHLLCPEGAPATAFSKRSPVRPR
jgi:ArsR family transcriptional regulator